MLTKKKYLTVVPPERKYLGINLTKPVQDLCAENYKTLMKKSKDLNK